MRLLSRILKSAQTVPGSAAVRVYQPEASRNTQQGDDWYYLNPDGSMATGWLLSQGSWYYLDPRDGRMVKDQVVGEYYIGQNGIWAP